MKNWTKCNVLLMLFALLLTYITEQTTRLLIGIFSADEQCAVSFVLGVDALYRCTAYWFKKRGDGSVLVSLILSFLFCGYHNAAITRFIFLFTGHYNLEATAFGLLMAIIYCSGILAGVDWAVLVGTGAGN